ncbi:uncharacterized protein LOC130378498 isoform X2 [Gadus chalcogrammus]|uniref:uncharacterized protein LOC130378498 isoform X2 n=1 Tax=Gadus chalcogrammus TaxID=1042646 RepID=UPI0024C41C38|nr:uncharacterized protein LOC130378498 isoform X2 [Gadus chalcogrammus]
MERVRERVRRGGGGGGGRGGGGRGRRRRRRRQEGAQRGPNLTNEIHATLVDHVVNHGLTLREAGLRVQPNLSRYTVASVMRTFRLENRIEGQGRQGGRPPMFTEQQEREIVNMVLANNAITLKQLQADIVNNHAIFNDIHQVSTSTLARILKKKHIQMKQIYRVPFERNSERVNRLRHDYAERVLRMDGEEIQHEFIYVDEAGFNLTRTRRRGRNIIGHRAIVNVPGQRGEEFFSAWRWKVYDLRLQAEVPLIQAMEEACDQMEVAAMQGWIRHSRRFFPRCLANDNIACDVDEILWPDPARRRDNV